MKKDIKKSLISIAATIVTAIILYAIGSAAGVFYGLDTIADLFEIDAEKIIHAILAVVIVVFVTNCILLVMRMIQNTNKKGRVLTMATVLQSLVRYAAVIIGVCWVLSIIGVNVSTIFASLGIVALILGFGAESLVADMVTGVFILFENQYNVGDIVEIDGFRGKVVAIGIRTISIEDGGKNVKIINNSNLKNIVNRSNNRSMAISDVIVSNATNLTALEKSFPEMLKAIEKKYADKFNSEIVYVGIETLANNTMTLRFKVEVDEEDIFEARRILNREIRVALAENSDAVFLK